MTGVSLQGLDHVLAITAVEGGISFRAYSMHFKASDSKVPRVVLDPMGPFFDAIIRRHQLPSADLDKAAHKQAKLCVSRL